MKKQSSPKTINPQPLNRKDTNMSANEISNSNPDNGENNRLSEKDMRIEAFLQYTDALDHLSVSDDKPSDLKSAIKCFRVAADLGCPAAQFNLGVCYHMGAGVKQNLKMAVRLFRKAAEQGVPEAQYFLGDCYYLGEGVKKNKAKAIELYLRAAERGNMEAKWALEGEDLDAIQ